MTTRLIAVLALAALVGGACSSGSSDPEVLGVVVERTSAPSDPASTVSDEPPSEPAEARDAVAVRTRAPAVPQAQPEPTSGAARPPATSAPPSEPGPDPSPTPGPVTLADGDGNTYTWTPREQPEEGFWWVEASSLPPSSPDESLWNGQRVRAVDVEAPADGSDAGTHPVRRVGCAPSITAPDDRAVTGSGNLTVELVLNGAVAASAVIPFEGEVAAGTSRSFQRLGDVQVDAREGDDVACHIRYDAS